MKSTLFEFVQLQKILVFVISLAGYATTLKANAGNLLWNLSVTLKQFVCDFYLVAT